MSVRFVLAVAAAALIAGFALAAPAAAHASIQPDPAASADLVVPMRQFTTCARSQT